MFFMRVGEIFKSIETEPAKTQPAQQHCCLKSLKETDWSWLVRWGESVCRSMPASPSPPSSWPLPPSPASPSAGCCAVARCSTYTRPPSCGQSIMSWTRILTQIVCSRMGPHRVLVHRVYDLKNNVTHFWSTTLRLLEMPSTENLFRPHPPPLAHLILRPPLIIGTI